MQICLELYFTYMQWEDLNRFESTQHNNLCTVRIPLIKSMLLPVIGGSFCEVCFEIS